MMSRDTGPAGLRVVTDGTSDTAGASEFKIWWLVDSDGVGVAGNLDNHTAAGAMRSLIRGYHLDCLFN